MMEGLLLRMACVHILIIRIYEYFHFTRNWKKSQGEYLSFWWF